MIFLVRHGQTLWNSTGRRQGRLDSPLTALGVEQARAVGRLLRDMVPQEKTITVETSPLGRARHTARIICEQLRFNPREISVEPLRIEHHQGVWQGLTDPEIEARYPEDFAKRNADKWNFRIPGGESYAELALRAKAWAEKKDENGVCIAVTHEMLSRTIQGAYLNMQPEETLNNSHNQNCVYRLTDGMLSVIRCSETRLQG